MVLQGADVQAVGPVDRSVLVGDGHDLHPGLGEEQGGVGAHLPEALHRRGGPRGGDADVLEGGQGDVHHPGRGRRGAPQGPAEAHRLAGDHPGHGVAGGDREGVHHPGHGLLVRADVRGGDVLVRADDRQDLGGVAAGQPFDLGTGVAAGVHGDAALGPAVGDVDQGALPGHPHRQGTDLVEVDLRAVAHPALGRAPGDVVLDPVAGQHLHRPVVTAQRDAHGHLPPRARQ